MSIDSSVVKKIARLARIKLSDEELVSYEHELRGILDWVEQLKEINTDGVEPIRSVRDTFLTLREDEVTDGGKRDEVLKNAPSAKYGCFVVPKVIE